MSEMLNELRRRLELGDHRRRHALFTCALEQGTLKIHDVIDQIDDNTVGKHYAMHWWFYHSLSLIFASQSFSPSAASRPRAAISPAQKSGTV